MSDLIFDDISSEEYRVYKFPSSDEVKIEKPVKLHVSPSGGHRLVDEKGISHYVPPKWIHLYWKPKAGMPNFVK